jgi:hypothetical protein
MKNLLIWVTLLTLGALAGIAGYRTVAHVDPIPLIKPEVAYSPSFYVGSSRTANKVSFVPQLSAWPPNTDVRIWLLFQPRVPPEQGNSSWTPASREIGLIRTDQSGQFLPPQPNPAPVPGFTFDLLCRPLDPLAPRPAFVARADSLPHSSTFVVLTEEWYRTCG